ncbi:ABC transporter permease [Enterococcus caccae]|uniref:Transport permease protein n=1 Tax=Enterococcus caccae ATCC BAA-1240 TaxID=1158612 RepID=R3WPA0_9ENTE|nr:ABC transporter permease [Enterococcus caccae]EOL43665.1 hypothetical protein UC7_02995 [Enterococcus caccae ATCC BAA-1240]EOT67935.1 hypothetical protein I580_00317 [Enterococcus caccae ATCC BAA-1240]
MIKSSIIMCIGEVKKQYRNYHNSLSTFMSLLIWPIITFFHTYFTYQSFDVSSLKNFNIHSNKEFIIFLITGALVFNCFWSMVQSAFFLILERQNGTIETTFLAPVNRTVLMYGRALGGLLTNVWMFGSFSLLLILLSSSISIKVLLLSFLSFFVILISSTIWGGFMNSLFLISRDANYLFSIFDEPMNLFSGTKMPVQAFPLWGRFISSFFPATYCLYIVRAIFLDQKIQITMILLFILSLVVLVLLTQLILYFAEKNNKKNGSLQLY